MTDLFSDRASRRKLATGDSVSEIMRPSSGRVLFISNAAFFAQRGKKMETKKEFSEDVLTQLTEKFRGDTVIVAMDPAWDIFEKPLEDADFDLRIFKHSVGSVGETTQRLIALLKGLGIRLKRIRNIRTVAPQAIYRFVDDENFIYLEGSDYEKMGIDPDKELTFQDMAKKRERSSWP